MIVRTLSQQRLLLTAFALAVGIPTSVPAQQRHFPLDHRQPAGVAGRWSVLTTPSRQECPQPVKISLPSKGEVAFYQGSPQQEVVVAAPAQADMVVGYVYRFRISHMPEFPNVELFPTVEIIDRLHPPQGLRNEFPIPVEITLDDIDIVQQQRMITKVIYLEQPNLAIPVSLENGSRLEDLPVQANLLEAADMRGRPMAILRMGGRIPDPQAACDEFYSRSPLVISTPAAPRDTTPPGPLP